MPMAQLPTETLAQYLAAMKILERKIGKQRLPAGYEVDLTNREVVVKFHPNTVVEREAGPEGTGQTMRIATQHTYSFAMIFACLHYFSIKLAKFRQQEKAEKLMLWFVGKIVRKAIDDGCTSKEAFERLHPRLAKGVEVLREKIRSRLPKIPYTTPQNVTGDAGITVKEQVKPPSSKAA
jgi:hypothetical protein